MAFDGKWQLEDGSGNWLVEDGSGSWVGEDFVPSGFVDGAVAFAGAGSATMVGLRVVVAAVLFAGAGSTAIAAQKVHVGAIGYQGVGTYAQASLRVAQASVAYAGIGSAAFAGEIRTPYQDAQWSASGAATFDLASVRVTLGQVTYAGAGSATIEGQRIVTGAFQAEGGALLEIDPQMVLGAGFGFDGSGELGLEGEVGEPDVDLVLAALADDSGPIYTGTESSSTPNLAGTMTVGPRYTATDTSGPRYG